VVVPQGDKQLQREPTRSCRAMMNPSRRFEGEVLAHRGSGMGLRAEDADLLKSKP
jgi:hypothetical protein